MLLSFLLAGASTGGAYEAMLFDVNTFEATGTAPPVLAQITFRPPFGPSLVATPWEILSVIFA
jgi:hypothetical protein